MRWIVLLLVPVLVAGSVASQENPAPTDISRLPALRVGETFNGEISENDPIVKTEILKTHYSHDPTRGKVYRIQVEESGPYHVDMKSYFFDAYLVLRSADGTVVSEDDDGLISTHARIVAELEFGKIYQVEICALHGMMGPFEVVLRKGAAKEISPVERSRLEVEDARENVRRLEAVCGPDDPEVAVSLGNLAGLLEDRGMYAEARPLYERCLEMLENTFGPDHPDVATSLNNLALLLDSQGLYSEARPLHERSLRIREKTFGPDHSVVAVALNNLAGFLDSQGLYSEARPLLERSIEIWEKTLGPDHPNVAVSLNHLAQLLDSQGQSAEARPLFERSLKIREKTLGPDHPDVATSLNNLALFFDSQGLYSEATLLLERSLKILEKTLGHDHPKVALALNNLAGLLKTQGLYFQARLLYERSLEILEKTLGPDHPNVATSLGSLAMLEADFGESRRAFELASKALLSRENQLEATLWSQTESERLRYSATLRRTLEVYLSLAREGTTGGGGGHEVVSSVLSWKGRVARSLLDQESQLASLSSDERAIVGQLRSVQKRLSDSLYSREVSDHAAHQELLMSLRDRKKELELALVRSRGERKGKGEKNRKRGIGLKRAEESKAVQESLPQGSVAVSFLVHPVYRPAEWREEELVRKGEHCPDRVSVFAVFSGKSDVQWLDLGEASILEMAMQEFLDEMTSRRGVQRSETGDSSPTTAATDRLRELLWDPLRELIGKSKLVIISPDTFLGTLPFETLQEKDGSYLVEKRSFVYIQDLLSLVDRDRERKETPPRLFAVGGIDYGRRGKLDSEFLQERLVAQAETRGGLPPRWGRLSLTGQEADAIVGLFEETRSEDADLDDDAKEAFTLLMRRKATEEAVKDHLERHTHVHLATHGYFQPEGLPSAWKKVQEEAEKNRGGVFLEETERAITGLMPGLLSGLVFSGANAEPEEGRDNGLLTAEEVTYLDLSECELVVLSACETGLGRPEGGEGMIGLRRSFRQAGARTVISSLWQVRDDSTQELMERFYENLWLKKMGKLEALRQAQLWMLRRNREEDGAGLPSTWGAFVLDGDWE